MPLGVSYRVEGSSNSADAAFRGTVCSNTAAIVGIPDASAAYAGSFDAGTAGAYLATVLMQLPHNAAIRTTASNAMATLSAATDATTIVAGLSNSSQYVTSSTMTVSNQFYPRYPPLFMGAPPTPAPLLSNNAYTIGLSNIFADALSCNVTYAITSNPASNITIVNNVLTVNGRGRSLPAPYTFLIAASNPFARVTAPFSFSEMPTPIDLPQGLCTVANTGATTAVGYNVGGTPFTVTTSFVPDAGGDLAGVINGTSGAVVRCSAPTSAAEPTIGLSNQSYTGPWMQMSSSMRCTVVRYNVTGTPSEGPSDWTLLGSDTGSNSTWSVVDARSNVSGAGQFMTSTYGALDPGFLHHRLVVTGARGSSSFYQAAGSWLQGVVSKAFPPYGIGDNAGSVRGIGNLWGGGNYTLTATSTLQPVRAAFDRRSTYWLSASNYSASSGAYTGSASLTLPTFEKSVTSTGPNKHVFFGENIQFNLSTMNQYTAYGISVPPSLLSAAPSTWVLVGRTPSLPYEFKVLHNQNVPMVWPSDGRELIFQIKLPSATSSMYFPTFFLIVTSTNGHTNAAIDNFSMYGGTAYAATPPTPTTASAELGTNMTSFPSFNKTLNIDQTYKLKSMRGGLFIQQDVAGLDAALGESAGFSNGARGYIGAESNAPGWWLYTHKTDGSGNREYIVADQDSNVRTTAFNYHDPLGLWNMSYNSNTAGYYLRSSFHGTGNSYMYADANGALKLGDVSSASVSSFGAFQVADAHFPGSCFRVGSAKDLGSYSNGSLVGVFGGIYTKVSPFPTVNTSGGASPWVTITNTATNNSATSCRFYEISTFPLPALTSGGVTVIARIRIDALLSTGNDTLLTCKGLTIRRNGVTSDLHFNLYDAGGAAPDAIINNLVASGAYVAGNVLNFVYHYTNATRVAQLFTTSASTPAVSSTGSAAMTADISSSGIMVGTDSTGPTNFLNKSCVSLAVLGLYDRPLSPTEVGLAHEFLLGH
jgi:hypothetical protein